MSVADSDYQGSFLIPTPKGVYQAEGDTNIALNYAWSAQNIRTERGLLASSYGTTRAFPPVGGLAIKTFERFYRRNFYVGLADKGFLGGNNEVFVACGNGCIYTYTEGDTTQDNRWIVRGEGFHDDEWSCITFDAVDPTYDADMGGMNTDVFLMTNNHDGMVILWGTDLRLERRPLNIGDDYQDMRFSSLALYNERVWGTGDPRYPDSLFYSKPYNPLDWTDKDVQDTPELGGGRIDQPTWDGDLFLALQPFGDYLLAIKQSTVFEVRGTDPSTYTFVRAFGTDGPISLRSIAVDQQRMYFMSRAGLGVYDGQSVRMLAKDALYETMKKRVKWADEEVPPEIDEVPDPVLPVKPGQYVYPEQMVYYTRSDMVGTACVNAHVYYVAFNIYSDTAKDNRESVAIEYDIPRNAFMLRTGVDIQDFYALNGVVYATQRSAPFHILRYNDPDANSYQFVPMDAYWETAWLDLGKAYRKCDFVIRFTADADDEDVPLEIYVATERREKMRVVMLHQQRRDYRVKIQLTGKRMKLRIRGHSVPSGWRIYGGVQVEYTYDLS